MRKKSAGLFVLITAIGFVLIGLTGCWGNQNSGDDNKEDNSHIIELSLSNYEYYLSIDKVKTESGSAMQGSYRYAAYKVTVSGAVSGLFEDCRLYYKIGDGAEREVKLNAAGFATFNYSWSSNMNGDFSFTRAEGKIII